MVNVNNFGIMTASIKRRLLSAFIGIIALLLIPTASFIVINYNIEAQYKKTTENVLLEYRIPGTSDAFISLYNSLLQDINNKEILSKYEIKSKEIDDIFFRLDKTITFKESRTIFKRLGGTVGFVKEYCKKGLENTRKGDFSRNSEILEQISRAKNNIRQDTADFILAELEFLDKQQQKLQTAVKLSWIFGLTLFVFVIVGGVTLAFIWSGGISDPLVELSKLAEDISKGNLQLSVQKEFLERKDEIGSLAGSFNTMVVNLEENIAQLNESNEQLKHTQAQLAQSAKMASVGLLAGGVAHEINNPLTGVLNNVQLIRMIAESKKDFNLDDFNELLNVVEESALRCTKITRSLLSFSQASKGMFRKISLDEILEKVIILIGHELSLQNIIIQKNVTPDLPEVWGDSQLLQQVVFDIFYNARWAIQEKLGKDGGTITIKTEHDTENRRVFIYIQDTGIGIPKENLARIFEPFFTTKPVGEGTGLGLSIAYNIIKQHNGNIEVESEVNQGTTFKITLPAA